jgi:autotransporter-associated beta strand protein
MVLGDSSSGDDFTMDFDLGANSNGNDENKDLLVLKGSGITVTGVGGTDPVTGTINFRGVLQDQDYLIIDGSGIDGWDLKNSKIDGITQNGSLSATLNGVNVATNSEPRGFLEFKLGTVSDSSTPGTSVWLVNNLNSLTMDWTGISGNTTSPASGHWEFNTDTMESLQTVSTIHTTKFQNSDKVHIYTDSNITVTLNTLAATPLAVDPYLSGLVIGQSSNTDYHGGNVTINGSGGITTNKDIAFGDYIASGIGTPKITPTGKLEKYGAGTLTLLNSGENNFLEGIDIYAGNIVLDGSDRLGKYGEDTTNHPDAGLVTFKNGATPAGIIVNMPQTLQNRILITGTGTSATFTANKDATFFNPQSGESNIDIASGTKLTINGGANTYITSGITGHSNLTKEGTGTLQIAADSYGSTTIVNEGTLRVLDNVIYGQSGEMLNVTQYGTIAGAGTFQSDINIVGGNISPDSYEYKGGTPESPNSTLVS